jgi:hypothetical protein
VFGGRTSTSWYCTSAEELAADGSTWSLLESRMKTGRCRFGAAALNGSVFLVGGSTGEAVGSYSKRVETFDTATRHYDNAADLPFGRSGHATVQCAVSSETLRHLVKPETVSEVTYAAVGTTDVEHRTFNTYRIPPSVFSPA